MDNIIRYIFHDRNYLLSYKRVWGIFFFLIIVKKLFSCFLYINLAIKCKNFKISKIKLAIKIFLKFYLAKSGKIYQHYNFIFARIWKNMQQ